MNWPDLDLDDIKDLGLDWDGEVLGGPPTPAPAAAPAAAPAHSMPRTISPSTFINTNSYPVSEWISLTKIHHVCLDFINPFKCI